MAGLTMILFRWAFGKRKKAFCSDGTVRVRELINFAHDEVPNLTRLSFGTEQKVEFSCGGNNFPLLGKP